ncbi:hypothetical protein ACCD10_22825 [Pseudomonas sp. Pseusp122]|uniref:hypothetical protein n=1 Tax=unclassified Pseudomonas TaxID=196821 RepID=UPI0039A59817
MESLDIDQITIILKNKLPGLDVRCTSKKKDVISLVVKSFDSPQAYEMTGIRLSHYRGKYGATALAQQLLEWVARGRTQPDVRKSPNPASPVSFEVKKPHSPKGRAILVMAGK